MGRWAPFRAALSTSAFSAAFGVAALGVGGSSGCSAPGRTVSTRPSLLESSRPLEPEVGPAEWRYHPRQSGRLTRSYDLGEGKRLFVGGLGERWLVDGKSGPAQPASILAPEPLVGALTSRGAPWSFVGQSGTTYEADAPLGPLLTSSTPLERLARVDAGRNNLLGVSRDGQLMLSEDAGLSWRAVGPSGTRFSDVLLAPPHALALAVPERLWWSETEGREWLALDIPPFGAERLVRDEDAGPVVASAIGARGVRLEGVPQLTPLGRSIRLDEPELSRPPVDGPSAKAIAAGRAFVTDGVYFEVALGLKAESLAGQFSGSLTRRPLPVFSACQDIQVAGFGSWVYAACTRERAGVTRRFEFFRSEDGGRRFEREMYTALGNPDQVRLAVGHAGALLATGLCLPQETLAGCRAQGINERRVGEGDAGAKVELRAVPVPALEESAMAMAFSVDGLTAYAVGQRTKSDALFVFVSSNLAAGFTARPISPLEQAGAPEPDQVHGLTPTRDGLVSLILGQTSGPQRIVILDAAARTLSMNAAPLDAAVLGAYGGRALAVSPDEVWESLNGGAQWERIGRLPRALCSTSGGRCSTSVHCQSEGCAIGDVLSRIGWRGQVQATATLPAPAPVSANNARRSVGVPLSCELSHAEWSALDGVARLPDASQAGMGGVAWFALSTDDATAAAGVWIAEHGHKPSERTPKLRYAELLGPTERPSEVAYHAALQVEGAAALRYALPGSAGASKTHLTRIEVAWENLLEGQRARGLIADAGGHVPGDFAKGEGMARRANADLLSIASGGIYVRVHRHPQHEQTSYFLDGSTVEEIPPLRWEPPAPKGSSSEMARLGRRHFPLLFVNQGATVVRARWGDSRWHFDAMSVGFTDVEDFSIHQDRYIVYVHGQVGIHLTTRGGKADSDGQIFPLQAQGPVFGAPIAVPTQGDLVESPLGCTPRQRLDSPRIVAPHHPGARRPLLIHDAVEPLRVMLTDSATLHGTRDKACVEIYDADAVKTPLTPAAPRERALVSTRGPSWLFRVAPDANRRDVRVEYRTMQCKTDPGLEVPSEVYEMPGTRGGG